MSRLGAGHIVTMHLALLVTAMRMSFVENPLNHNKANVDMLVFPEQLGALEARQHTTGSSRGRDRKSLVRCLVSSPATCLLSPSSHSSLGLYSSTNETKPSSSGVALMFMYVIQYMKLKQINDNGKRILEYLSMTLGFWNHSLLKLARQPVCSSRSTRGVRFVRQVGWLGP